jgi:threonine synthase
MKFICSNCGKEEDVTTKKSCCDCGGLWKLAFDAPEFNLSEIDKDTWGLYRYKKFLPIEDEDSIISLGEGMTPIVQFDEDVMLKMDYFMPTLSYKDRGASILISHAKSIGVKSVVQDSSGNAGNSVAAYCARAGIECEIFVPEGTSPKKIGAIEAHGAKVNVVPGNRDHCADVCREKARTEGKYYANHVYNPFFYQGTKTYMYETYEQLGRVPENIFVPIGNGTLFLGVVFALQEFLKAGIIEKFPNVIAVQSENCAPIKEAFDRKKREPEKIDVKPTLAEGIAIGVPMRGKEMLEYIYKYDIDVVTAPEDEILSARAILAKKGIYVEHTTAAIFAAFLEQKKHREMKDVLIPLTGAGIKSDK